MKVKTFSQSLNIFQATKEISDLDSQVNEFIKSQGVKKIYSVSDTTTTTESGTIGIIRVLAYEE